MLPYFLTLLFSSVEEENGGWWQKQYTAGIVHTLLECQGSSQNALCCQDNAIKKIPNNFCFNHLIIACGIICNYPKLIKPWSFEWYWTMLLLIVCIINLLPSWIYPFCDYGGYIKIYLLLNMVTTKKSSWGLPFFNSCLDLGNGFADCTLNHFWNGND